MRMGPGDGGTDPDRMDRPVMAGRIEFLAGPGGMELADHGHRAAQMIYVARGVLTCHVARGLWLVPPQCALWIPGGARHVIKGVGKVEVYSLFVNPDSATSLPDACCTVSVSALLREVLFRFAEIPDRYPVEGVEARLAAVLLDELAAAPVEKLHLMLPSDDRLRTIADELAANPADRSSAREWAGRVGAGERTLNRLVLRETGMSFGRWRRQLHISLAVQWLSQGTPVHSVATKLGYESASSFVFMFRKVLGSPPARYMARKLADSPGTPEVRPPA